MAHHHHHSAGDRNAYYLDQLFTIAVCGALGGVAIMLWYTGKLGLMLHPKFFLWVLLSSVPAMIMAKFVPIHGPRPAMESAEKDDFALVARTKVRAGDQK